MKDPDRTGPWSLPIRVGPSSRNVEEPGKLLRLGSKLDDRVLGTSRTATGRSSRATSTGPAAPTGSLA